jgi:hypothetical protein
MPPPSPYDSGVMRSAARGTFDGRLVVRTLEPRVWAVIGWCLLGSLIGAGLGLLVFDSVLTTPGVTVAVSIAVAGSAWSFLRMALVVDESGVEIRNFIRTWRLSWQDIAEIGVKHVGHPGAVSGRRTILVSDATPPAIGFATKTGRYVPAAQATAYMNSTHQRQLLEVLVDFAAPHNIPVTVRPQELGL